MISIDRRQVLAYRAHAQGLHRDRADAGDLAVLDLGVQDTPRGSAGQAMAVRLGAPPAAPDETLPTTWSVRGAPHVHRAGELVTLSRALWPWSDDDALARLDTSAGNVRRSGMSGRQALRVVAERIADIVTQPMAKGAVSGALTPRVPAEMTVDCRQCEATHIVETLFRSAVLPAGITFAPDEPVVTFVPVAGWPGVPEETSGTADLVTAYLRLLGPARPADVAGFLGTKPGLMAAVWPQGLVEVDVGGTSAWIPEADRAALAAPPDPPAVRLLPPSDPFLQARDRELLAPDPAHRKVLWPILGRPGALLVDGDITGTWRVRKKARRVAVTVAPFGRLPATARRGLDEEAELLAAARGAAGATVTVD